MPEQVEQFTRIAHYARDSAALAQPAQVRAAGTRRLRRRRIAQATVGGGAVALTAGLLTALGAPASSSGTPLAPASSVTLTPSPRPWAATASPSTPSSGVASVSSSPASTYSGPPFPTGPSSWPGSPSGLPSGSATPSGY